MRMNASKSNENLLNSIGADIHDGPVQLLSALLLKPHDVDLVRQLARQVLDELREISGGLVLPELEPLPLKAVFQPGGPSPPQHDRDRSRRTPTASCPTQLPMHRRFVSTASYRKR